MATMTSKQNVSTKWKVIAKNRQVYVLMLVGVVFYLLFKIMPIWGLGIAFVDFKIKKGLLGSAFVGFKYFTQFFNGPNFWTMLRNTLVISLMNLLIAFPMPIILALLFNEVRHERYKKIVQSVVYMPHFLSWTIVTGITFFLLSTDIGIINKFIRMVGGSPYPFLTTPETFWWVILCQNIWKEMGWGTIIYLAAISQVDQGLFEAATIDGANRFQRVIYVTIPSIMPTLVVMFIMQLGKLMNVNFDQLWMMGNDMVRSVSETFETYSFRAGIQQGNYSVGTAVGIFKSFVGLALVLVSNKCIKLLGNDGMF